MANHRIEMRLMGTEKDLIRWIWLMRKMQDREIIEILEESKPYKNRGDSKMYRVYLKIDLELDESE